MKKGKENKMKNREQIFSERATKGFCCCHTCIERSYEDEYFWYTWRTRTPKKTEIGNTPKEVILLEDKKKDKNGI